MTEGSKSLYSASQGWAHIKNVDILVPESWSHIQANIAHQVHEDAEIRVEPTSAIYGDSPFTLQTRECGQQAEFIQVRLHELQTITCKQPKYLTRIQFYNIDLTF